MIALSRRTVVPLVALLCLLLAPAPAQAEVAVPAGATRLTIDGQGHGHGHGLSQYGAAAAARQGVRYRQILRHYYPGTGWGRAGGRIKVLLTGDRTPDLVVVNRKELRAQVVGGRSWRLAKVAPKPARKATRWRIVPIDGARSALEFRKRKGGWRRFVVVTGTLEFTAGGKPITLVAGGRHAYRGALRAAIPTPGGRDRDTVNLVPLEAYLRGVVPREVPALWPTHAVRAQAVAARSYAAFERQFDSHGYFEVYDTTADQVYGGVGSEHPAATRAIKATRSQVLTHAGAPAFTQFSASNGGWMLAGSRPYLVSGRDPYDPVRRWTTTVSLDWLRSVALSAGTILGIDVVTHPNAGPWVDQVVVRGSKKTVSIDGDRFRSLAGLKSASFRLRVS